MDDNMVTHPRLKTIADYKMATEECLEEMARLRTQIERDDADIERLKRETRALLAQMKAA